MKTLEIKIKSEEESYKDVINVVKAIQSGKKIKPIKGTYFSSLEAVRNLLTPRRWALLHSIKEKHPKSILELSRIVERNFKNVYDDVKILKDYGLVQMNKIKPARKTHTQGIDVPYQAINIHAHI